MKYKAIKSLAHNFTHSFLSYMNYVDDVHVVDEILSVVRETGLLTITWLPSLEYGPKVTPRIEKSIAYYRDWLPKLAESQSIDLDAVVVLRTEVYKRPSMQVGARVYLQDDQGRERTQNVRF